MAYEYTAPPREITVSSVSQYPDGRVNEVSALIIDALGHEFSFVLSTAAKVALDGAQDTSEAIAFLDDDREPIFVAPGNEIDPEEIEAIVANIDSNLLRKYLTPQVS